MGEKRGEKGGRGDSATKGRVCYEVYTERGGPIDSLPCSPSKRAYGKNTCQYSRDGLLPRRRVTILYPQKGGGESGGSWGLKERNRKHEAEMHQQRETSAEWLH